MTPLTWLGILICLSQSAMLSGMNLGLFSIGKLELEVEAKKGNPRAKRVQHLRRDANFALVTILWGNVGVNVLLALLSGSVLSGVTAFLFSTVVITIFAEIIPQAYFTRHALRAAASLSPVLRFYQFLLYPVARPTAWALDRWLGGERIRFYPEHDLRQLIRLHMDSSRSEIARVEGQGALNFLELDDVAIDDEGEPLDRESVIQLPFDGDQPVFPRIAPRADDRFLRQINRSGKSWVVILDRNKTPRLLLKTDDFLRDALFSPEKFRPLRHCHRPIITREKSGKMGELIQRFRVNSTRQNDDIVEEDVILFWGPSPRLVTGTDILGRLLRGIARTAHPSQP